MDIKFKELERNEGQNQKTGKVWVAYKIVGTKIKDGTEWKSSNIFDNQYNRDLLDKARELEEGEKVNVKLEQKGDFWNPIDILDYVEREPYMPGKKGSGGSAPSRSQSGGSFEWKGRTGEAYDRSSAVYLAWDIMKETSTKKQLTEVKVDAIFSLADTLYNYIHAGNSDSPVSGDDALEPPKV